VKRLTPTEAVVGAEFRAVVIENLPRTLMVQYAGAAGDYNPLHTDEIYATEVGGHPSVFAHGMLTMGLTGRMITDLVGDGALTAFGGRFLGQVWPGDSLSVRAIVTAVSDGGVDLEVLTTNANGDIVFSGTASATLSSEKGGARD
jgi:acyl dehydratase